ncbi:beta subunit of citrate lyase, partial [Coemansia reversa NRRL 1564]
VPCSEPRKIRKAQQSAADCVMYDLEDGVATSCKEQARRLLAEAAAGSRRGAEVGVRINAIGSGLEDKDLCAALQAERLDVVLVPKVNSATDVQHVCRAIDRAGRSAVRVIASIESARALVNIHEIAQADARVDALLFAAEDYCADAGVTRTATRRELYHARAVVANAAHAFRLQAIDMVAMDFRDADVLCEEAEEGAAMGFTGKQVIHPAQLSVVQRCFAPTPAAVLRARRIVDGFRRSCNTGRGAFELDGKAVDMPVVKCALRVLRR